MNSLAASVRVDRPQALRMQRPRPPGGLIRLMLTSAAPSRIRLHVVRGVARVATLAVADLATLVLLQGALMTSIASVAPRHFVAGVLVALALMGCYGAGDRRRDSGAIIRASGLATALAFWSQIAIAPIPSLLAASFGLWAATAVTIIVQRKLLDYLLRLVRPGHAGVMRVAVVGTRKHAARLIDHPVFGEGPSCHLAAFFDPRRHRGDAASALAELIRDRRIDTILLAGRLDTPVFRMALDVAGASGCQVFSLPRVSPSSTLLPNLHWRNGYPVVELTHPGLMGAKLIAKRLIDLAIAASALVALAPLLGLIALVIRLKTKGPVLFRQTRIGQGGKEFTILKFRTMVPNAEEQRQALLDQSVYRDGRLFKVERDPRVTPIGAFLRRTSLDELPQLWNVVRGDMSLVGPRPPIPSEVQLYREHHYARFDVKPGVTGPWQVSGRNSIRDFDNVIRLETDYIRRWTIGLDLALLARTVPAVLSRRGAH